jgi:hypothetical protein
MISNFKFSLNKKNQNQNNLNMNNINLQLTQPPLIYNTGLEILPYDINNIRKRGIKVIHNVYQSKYKYGISSTGLGDFIRGSYFIIEFCIKYKFMPKIVFNNCISKFLKINTIGLEKIQYILAQILSFPNVNFTYFKITMDRVILEPIKDTRRIMSDFVEYLTLIPVYNHNVFAYCISYPRGDISDIAKIYMKTILEPGLEVKLEVNKNLNELELLRKEFSVIHIRSGDKYLKKTSSHFKPDYINNLLLAINERIDVNKKYLLISDNNQIKKIVLERFPGMKAIIKEITHFGEGEILEDEKVKNTLIDFYLLSLTREIFSFSAYKHGSGFSYWCARTYDIPYICKYII